MAASQGLEDDDLLSIQQVRSLLKKAKAAQQVLATLSQEQVDRICEAMCQAGFRAAEPLARLTVEESGFGVVDYKTKKNQFATQGLWEAIKGMKTVGILRRDDEQRVYEIAEPMGVTAGIIPITNPTSTAMFKCIVSIKARNAIVISPHPRGVRCISESCRVVYEAALRAGAPEGCIGWLTISTLPGTEELMKHRDTALILATGGSELVKAAYSAGKPAYGVGPGNVPCWIDRSADVKMAAAAVVSSQTFDNGTLCCSEQALVVDEPVRDAFLRNLVTLGAYVCNEEEIRKLEKIVAKGRRMNPDIVGQFPARIAEMAGFAVPPKTTLLVCPLRGVGWDWPISIEKLCPMVALYVESGWEAGCHRCIEVLRFGGLGHTLVIHATDQRVIMEYAMKKPAFRILVNSPASQGSVGFHTNLVPSMTLGCGTPGNNITSDNVNPMNLVNIKRLAYVNELFLEEYDRTWRQRLEGNAPAPRWGGSAPFDASPFPAPPVVNAASPRGDAAPQRGAPAAGGPERVPPYRGFDAGQGASAGGPWPLPPRPMTVNRGEVLSPGDIESMISRGRS